VVKRVSCILCDPLTLLRPNVVIRAAQRANVKEKNAGGSSEKEEALVAAPVIRQRQTATQG
jgi:hypothetical protein